MDSFFSLATVNQSVIPVKDSSVIKEILKEGTAKCQIISFVYTLTSNANAFLRFVSTIFVLEPEVV